MGDTSLTRPQIKHLRALANTLNPMLWIGKGGVSQAAIDQASASLEAHELLKCAVQDGSPLDVREASAALAEATGAQIVQLIGHRFVLYRRSSTEGFAHIALQ